MPNLDNYVKAGFLDKKKEKAQAEEMKETLNIKTPSLETSAGSLSGGNQQKIVIAKWVLHQPKNRMQQQLHKPLPISVLKQLVEQKSKIPI